MENREDQSWTFAAVQERLVEAMLMLWRLPDRERGWLRVSISSLWSQYHPTVGMNPAERAEYLLSHDRDEAPRLPGLTRAQVGAMEEALGWMRFVDVADRKLVGLAITQLAEGHSQVSWRRLLKPMGLTLGADGLRMRYGRALNRIAVALDDGGNPCLSASRP
ncbi:hypothetical protein ACFSGX_14000 [Sphingomonas arantia]|uniref:DUF2384 domain-containing protein n=1 Tax=Sphingomonas arantia TaxID=1460676 RepID=A0ABW4U1P5_9SPHN